jgi:hypothetical protein
MSGTSDIQRVIDEAAIRDVHLRYCRGIDRRDWALVRSCYHPGAKDHHGPYNGNVEGFIAFAIKALEACESVSHFTGNQLVNVDGDVAWHEAYCRAYQRVAAAGGAPAVDVIVNSRCFDRMEWRSGRWGIADRVVIVDSVRHDPVIETAADQVPWHVGRADQGDPSYNRSIPQAEYLGLD